jgi:glycolate oxidase FAD binding subunit
MHNQPHQAGADGSERPRGGLSDPIPGPIAAACESVRPATAADAVAGVQPGVVAEPASIGEASALLRAASGLGLAIIPRGTGTRMHWGNPPERCDLIIDMTRMDHVIEHTAGDLVATVQAGLRLDRLAEVLGTAGQRLALDPPGRGGPSGPKGTVGGVLATGAAGPLRSRYGTGRDLLIGITVVRADGTVARSGGKVVKNVAGYDLGKLFAGSRGTLGLIVQATFRLHPVPARTAYVTAECLAAADACGLIDVAMRSVASPVAAEIDWPGANEAVRACVALEGDPVAVTERASSLVGLLGRGAAPSIRPDPPPWWGSGPAAQPDGTVLQVGFWPGDLGLVLAEIRAAAAAAGLDPPVSGSAAGVLYAAIQEGADPAAVAEFVSVLRGALGHNELGRARPGERTPPARCSVVIQHAPREVAKLVDLFGPVPSLALMRAVKSQFDPARTMAPGRFAGGI